MPISTLISRRRIQNRDIKLIDIPRTGPLAQLPVEIQLEIFSYTDYVELNNLKSTCRYYRQLISKSILDDAMKHTKDKYEEMDRNKTFPKSQTPCYTCLRLKDKCKFHEFNGTNYSGNIAPIPDPRCCITCGVKNKIFPAGQAILSGNVAMAICKHCKRFQKKPVYSNIVRDGYACRSCDEEVGWLQRVGVNTRCIQAIFAIIIFALACSGRAAPRSSHITHGIWRWIYTISVDLLTTGACIISSCFRIARRGDGDSLRDDDYTFSLPIEMLGMFGWATVFVSLIWEATHPLYKGEFDSIAVALAVMSCFEFLSFFLTLAVCSSRCVRYCVVNQQDEYSIIV